MSVRPVATPPLPAKPAPFRLRRAAGLVPWVLVASLAAFAGTALADATVDMATGTPTGMTWSPNPVQVFEGEAVTWKVTDASPHVVSSSSYSFTSPEVPAQGSWSMTFDKVGSFPYKCTYHPPSGGGNDGTLEVKNRIPTIAFTSAPEEGSSVSGSLRVEGTASDGAGTWSVEVSIDDGITWASAALDGASWGATIDLSEVAHGTTLRLKARVRDDENSFTDTPTRTLFLNVPPTAAFTFTPAQPTSLDEVRFADASTDDHSLQAWSWDFGDGANSTERNATHTYGRKGTFTVTLRVTDDDGGVAETQRTLTLLNTAPRPDFEVFPDPPARNETVEFRSVTLDDGTVAATRWDFGDGTTATGPNATHVYAEPGTYNITLNVTDDDGLTAELTRAITVELFPGARPIANLTATPRSGQAPLVVDFTISGYDPDGMVHNWTLEFGDGSTPARGPASAVLNGITFNHTYRRGGNFTALLSILDTNGTAGFNRTTLDIAPAPNRPPEARFTVTPGLTPRKGSPVGFASDSSDPDFEDAVVQWSWDFGDGTRVCCNRSSVEHTYTRVGRFTASLVVTDKGGLTDRRTAELLVSGLAPQVVFEAVPAEGRAPLPVVFQAALRDPDGNLARWRLDFGDGTPAAEGSGAPGNDSLRHIYEQAGSFSASLEITDDDGLTTRAVAPVEVRLGLPPPVQLPPGAISATPTEERLTYRFVATPGLTGAFTYQWEFGDGPGKATGREVRYSYLEAGTYRVTLTVSTPDGPVARAATELVVEDAVNLGARRVEVEVGNGVVRLRWQGDARADGYQVWRQAEGERFRELAVVRGALGYDDLAVQDGVAYTYAVTFFEASGDGKLQQLSRLNRTEAYRNLGEARTTAFVDRDGDGVGDAGDAFPDDPTRSGGMPLGALALAGVLVGGLAGAGAWVYRAPLRARLLGAPMPRPLTDLPGLEPEHAAILRGAGIADVPALAAADPRDLARRTILPLHRLAPWHAMAALLQVPGVGPAEAAQLVRAGVRGPADLARAVPEQLAAALTPPLPPPKVARWVRAAQRARERAPGA